MNHSITVYVDQDFTAEDVRSKISKATSCKVIVNGISTFCRVYERNIQTITILDIDKNEWRKLKNRKAVKQLREAGLIHTTV
jgi:hypothetical protein|tara:strand:+ start:1505 stop:1750 length:246 start_codon:yes stop_codon:yes gene_type:complete